jgi:hypothetical protein
VEKDTGGTTRESNGTVGGLTGAVTDSPQLQEQERRGRKLGSNINAVPACVLQAKDGNKAGENGPVDGRADPASDSVCPNQALRSAAEAALGGCNHIQRQQLWAASVHSLNASSGVFVLFVTLDILLEVEV